MPRLSLRATSVPLQQRKHELVRREIWGAALGLFAGSGFEATTVEQIASAAGLSPRTFFRYFASKEDVILQGVETYGDDLVAVIAALPPSPPTLSEICRAVAPLMEHYVQTEPYVKTVMRIVCGSTVLRGAEMQRFRVVERRLAQEFEQRMGASPKCSRQAKLLASVALAASNIAFDAWLEQDGGPIVPLVEELFAAAGELA